MKNIKLVIAVLLIPAALILTGCSSAPSSTEPVDLAGDWSYSKDAVSFDAEIKEGHVEIFLTLDDTEGLYWSGTFTELAKDSEEIVSKADIDALNASLYGSTDSTKTFTYSNGEIRFPFEIMGTKTEVNLKR